MEITTEWGEEFMVNTSIFAWPQKKKKKTKFKITVYSFHLHLYSSYISATLVLAASCLETSQFVTLSVATFWLVYNSKEVSSTNEKREVNL